MSGFKIDGVPVLGPMKAAVQKASDMLKEEYARLVKLRASQGDISAISRSIDMQVEEEILRSLKMDFPTVGYEAEEGGVIAGLDPDHSWVLDPIDGTANLLHGLPFFGTSLALRKGPLIVAGVVCNPIVGEIFTAERGHGAFLNDSPIRVSSCERIDRAMLSNGTPWGTEGSKNSYMESINRIMNFAARLRRFGVASLDLAYVASGRYDGYFVTHLSPWDIAAGMLLVEEAGGRVSEINGGHQSMLSGSVLATNAHIHNVMMDLLKR